MKLLCINDAHINPNTWESWPALKGDGYMALELLGDYAKMHKITKCLFTGDAFDTKRPYSSDLDAMKSFATVFDNVYFINGTHDDTQPPLLSALSGYTYLTGSPVVLDGALFVGIDYCRHRELLLEKIQEMKPVFEAHSSGRKFLVLHQAFQHLLGFEGTWQITAEDIQDTLPDVNVLVGHIHKRDTLVLENMDNPFLPGSYIHSTGVLYPQDWEQTKQFSGADVLDTVTGEITPVPICVRKYYTLSASDPDILSTLSTINMDRESLLPAAVRINVEVGTTSPVMPDLYPNCLIKEYLTRTNGGSVEHLGSVAYESADGVSLEQAIREELPDELDQEYMVSMLRPDVSPKKFITEEMTKDAVVFRQ